MRAGRLRDKIRIDKAIIVEDATRAVTKDWQEVATVRAAIVSGRGREGNASGTDYAETTVQIIIRRIPGVDIDAALRVTDVRRGDVFDVVAVRPAAFYNDFILDAKRGGAKAP